MAKNLGRQKIKERKAEKKAEVAKVNEENQFNQDFDNFIKETIEKIRETFNAKMDGGDFSSQSDFDNAKTNLLNGYANLLKQAEGKNLSPEDTKKVKIIQKASQEISAKLDNLFNEINQIISVKKEARDIEKNKFVADAVKNVIDNIKSFHSGNVESLKKELESLSFYEQKTRDFLENGDNSNSDFDASKFIDKEHKVRSPEGKKLLQEISIIDYTTNSEGNTYQLNKHHNIIEQLCEKLEAEITKAKAAADKAAADKAAADKAAADKAAADKAAADKAAADKAAADKSAADKAAADKAAANKAAADKAAADKAAANKAAAEQKKLDEKASQDNIEKVLDLKDKNKALEIFTKHCSTMKENDSCDDSSNHEVDMDNNDGVSTSFCCPHTNFLEDYTVALLGSTD